MATINNSVPHIERTATQPRENAIESVILSKVTQINPTIRLLRLSAVDPNHTIRFLPGQWLDTFVPSLSQAGGFTITSTPFESRPSSHSSPYLELAIQKSRNPPAQWLWRPEAEILGSQLTVRVGGNFTWPPPKLDHSKINRLVLIAGGVGINPLISIFSSLVRLPDAHRPKEIHFLYATKFDQEPTEDPQAVLFLTRLMDLVSAAADARNVTLSLFVTGSAYEDGERVEHGKLPNRTFARRIVEADLKGALDGWRGGDGGGGGREGTVCYVCGPPKMTDEITATLAKQEGMDEDRVLCEKWW